MTTGRINQICIGWAWVYLGGKTFARVCYRSNQRNGETPITLYFSVSSPREFQRAFPAGRCVGVGRLLMPSSPGFRQGREGTCHRKPKSRPQTNRPCMKKPLQAKSQGPRIEMQTGVRAIERVIAVECRGWVGSVKRPLSNPV